MKRLNKVLSLVLAFSMIVGFFPVNNIYAEEMNDLISEESDMKEFNGKDEKDLLEEKEEVERTIESKVSEENLTSRDISRIVDGISITPRDITDGGRFTIDVKFSEKEDLKLENGDILILKFPEEELPDGVTLNGYQSSINLEKDGMKYGEMRVEKHRAIVEFNENISKVGEVKGDITFQIEGRNLIGNKEDENIIRIPINFGINHLNKQIISITKPASGTGSVFYYATAGIQTERPSDILWYSIINNKGQEVFNSDLVLESTVDGENHILKEDTIEIRVDNRAYSREEFESLNYGKIDILDNKIFLTIDKDFIADKDIVFYYETKAIYKYGEIYKISTDIYEVGNNK